MVDLLKKFYEQTVKIIVNEGNRISIYTGRITSDDGEFITIVDKFDKLICLNKNCITRIELYDTNKK